MKITPERAREIAEEFTRAYADPKDTRTEIELLDFMILRACAEERAWWCGLVDPFTGSPSDRNDSITRAQWVYWNNGAEQ
jgi:hypothetical protein